MVLYYIKQNEDPGYDVIKAAVVAACSPHDARKCMQENERDFHPLDWSYKSSSIKKIGTYSGPRKQPFILITDVHEG